MFNFKKQFKRYNRPFTAIVEAEKGYYDKETGEYVPAGDPEEVKMKGIILQLNDDDLRFEEGGTLTFEDKKILLDTDHFNLTHKQRIKIEGVGYQVHNIAPYDRYSHFEKVIVKRVSIDD